MTHFAFRLLIKNSLFTMMAGSMWWLIACSERDENIEQSFRFPEVIDPLPVSGRLYTAKGLTFPRNDIKAILPVGKPVDLYEPVPYQTYLSHDRNMFTKAYMTRMQRTGLAISVDTTRDVTLDFGESGFVKAMPVYLINTTTHTVHVQVQTCRIVMIQEAMDAAGNWQPIEKWENLRCGNAYCELSLPPDYCIMTKVIRYSGTVRTPLRLKCLNAGTVIYSESFWGNVQPRQLHRSAVLRH